MSVLQLSSILQESIQRVQHGRCNDAEQQALLFALQRKAAVPACCFPKRVQVNYLL
jgi:hypothetical protein